MASIVPYYCPNCPFKIDISFRGRSEHMLINYNGRVRGFCIYCEKFVELDATEEFRLCPECSNNSYLGWNVFDCPKCGETIKEDGENVVSF